ncbi:MAG: protein kinase [Tannerella sp.]|jgi:serine/threonine protein kinase|nr:protein kinase [Tannerella sp.]
MKEGTIFDKRYLLKERIGSGGFSKVWLVEDIKTKLVMAMKIYASGMSLDKESIDVFAKEFAIVFKLNHPNLLRPNFYGEVKGIPYLTLPYCKNGSALSIAGKTDETMAWRFLHDVASGLACLHSQKSPIIHQDIKPDNIMIDDERHFLITDFGISETLRYTQRQNVNAGGTTGSLAYVAPERFGPTSSPIMASDIWALGATLFELITGDLPFGPSGGLIQKSGAEIPEIEGNYSNDLKTIIKRCLSLNPWDRPKADEIVELAKNPLLLPPPPPSYLLRIIFALLAVVFSTGMGWYLYRKYNPVHPDTVNSGITINKDTLPWNIIDSLPHADTLNNNRVNDRQDTVPVPSLPKSDTITNVTETDELESKDTTLPQTKPKLQIQPKPISPKPDTDYMQEGTKYYNSGDYKRAIENYRKVEEDPSGGAEARIRTSEKCLEILKSADRYFKTEEFEKAKAEYEKILKENRSDRNAKAKIEICKKELGIKAIKTL